jgi:hypothetical protein
MLYGRFKSKKKELVKILEEKERKLKISQKIISKWMIRMQIKINEKKIIS